MNDQSTLSATSLEAVWELREELIYPQLFGPKGRDGIFVLRAEIFTGQFQQADVDPRWLHHGVIEHGPTDRGTWIYITSGLSNPWQVPPQDYGKHEFSGFGTELAMETRSRADWPVLVLQRILAFDILLAHGRYGDKPPLDYGDRIPLGAPLVDDSVLHHLVIGYPTSYPARFVLPSGKVDILHVVGITEDERDYAKANGSDALVALLQSRDAYPVTDPARACVLRGAA